MKTSTKIILVYFTLFLVLLGSSFVYHASKIDRSRFDGNIRLPLSPDLGISPDGDVSMPEIPAALKDSMVTPDGDITIPTEGSGKRPQE